MGRAAGDARHGVQVCRLFWGFGVVYGHSQTVGLQPAPLAQLTSPCRPDAVMQ